MKNEMAIKDWLKIWTWMLEIRSFAILLSKFRFQIREWSGSGSLETSNAHRCEYHSIRYPIEWIDDSNVFGFGQEQ